MKLSSILAAAAALLTTVVCDENRDIIGPFALRVTGGPGSLLNGNLWGCHADAATEGLCYAEGGETVTGAVYEFYYNFTYSDDYVYPGSISYVWSYQGTDGDAVQVPSFMHIYPNFASNVHPALIPMGTDDGTSVNLYFDTGVFYIGMGYDDTHANSSVPLTYPSPKSENWHICYQWTGAYWYRSLAWVSSIGGFPQNPSCEPVYLQLEALGDKPDVEGQNRWINTTRSSAPA